MMEVQLFLFFYVFVVEVPCMMLGSAMLQVLYTVYEPSIWHYYPTVLSRVQITRETSTNIF